MIERKLCLQRNIRIGLLTLVAGGALIAMGSFAGSRDATLVYAIVLTWGPALILTLCLGRWGIWFTTLGMPLAPSARGYGPPRDVLRRIDAEIATGEGIREFGGWRLWQFWAAPDLLLFTPNWLVQVNAAGISIVQLDDVLWVFERTREIGSWLGLQHVSLGFRIYYLPDQWEVIPLADAELVEEALAELLRRRPGVLTGFFENLQYLAEDNPARMVEKVAFQQREWEALSGYQRKERCAARGHELAEARQHLALRDADPCSDRSWSAWRSLREKANVPEGFGPLQRRPRAFDQTVLVPQPRVSLQHVIAAEWRRLLWELLLLPFLTAICLSYVLFFFVMPVPYPSYLLPMGMMLTFLVGVWSQTIIRWWRRTFLWGLRRQIAAQGPRDDVVQRIDAEMAAMVGSWSVGKGRDPRFSSENLMPSRPDFLALSPSWLMEVRPARAVLIHLPDLMWVWKRIVPKTIWFFGANYTFQLGCRLADGSLRLITTAGETELDDLAEMLFERCPALLVGWRGDCHTLHEAGPEALRQTYRERVELFERRSQDEREEWLDRSDDLFQRFIEHVT